MLLCDYILHILYLCYFVLDHHGISFMIMFSCDLFIVVWKRAEYSDSLLVYFYGVGNGDFLYRFPCTYLSTRTHLM